MVASEAQPGEGVAPAEPQRSTDVTGRSEEEKGSSFIPDKKDAAALPTDMPPETPEDVVEVSWISGSPYKPGTELPKCN